MTVAKPAKKTEKPKEQIVAQNRAASYNYHLLERLEAGIVLHGTEVKALREGTASYCCIKMSYTSSPGRRSQKA